jgi:hypothetical protein
MNVGDLVTMKRVWFDDNDEISDIGLIMRMEIDNFGDEVVQVQWADGEKVWMMEDDLEVINDSDVSCKGKDS